MSDLPDDDTIRVRRSWAGTPPGPGGDGGDPDVDETTAVSRRRSSAGSAATAGSARGAAAYTAPAAPAAPAESAPDAGPRRTDASFSSMPAGAASTDPNQARPRRSTYIDSPIDTEESTDGSTIVARRESRRRASRDLASEGDPTAAPRSTVAPAPGAGDSSGGRVALTPDGRTETFGVRRSQPVIAERREAPPRSPGRPIPPDSDAAATASTRRAEDRRATVIVVGTASAIVVAAASALIAIVLSL